MATRRSQGEGGVHFDERRQRWIATAQVGFQPNGKRIVKRASGLTKTAAKNKLKDMLRDLDDGLGVTGHQFTVGDAVRSWLEHGLNGRDRNTIKTNTILAQNHVIPGLGACRLRELTADDVDRWLAKEAKTLSTATVQRVLSILRRAIGRAMARDQGKRNVALLCEVPRGQAGRESKSLTLDQAKALLEAAKTSPLHAYIVLSLLTGARTEELRALTWAHVDLGDDQTTPPRPPSIQLWRSVRASGDTKTRRSRRTLRLPQLAVSALTDHRQRQQTERDTAGSRWLDHDLVFSTRIGTELDAANVRRSFRAVCLTAGLDSKAWTPRELRHSFVSLMSAAGVPLEDIARIVGHRGTVVTEAVYRKQLRPLLTEGAEAMDRVFGEAPTSDPGPAAADPDR